MIIVVGGEKGGTGKSCLAQNLAVYFNNEQQASVVIVDCDPQQATMQWCQERDMNRSLPNLKCVQLSGKIRNELLSLSNHYDVVIVDCGGRDNMALRSSISVAHHVLIPVQPKRRDLKTVPLVEDIISTCRMVNPNMNAAFVLTQCSTIASMAPRLIEAKETCRGFEIQVLNSVTFSRSVYDDAEESGASVFEIEPKGKAAAELRGIIEELLARNASNKIDMSEPLHVQAFA
ncbi:AAA family ATPase [Alteromonas facilis]|uniref:AAA family ATPase n=1 Tax=Alteromonas facilis TaxID=2048004 RepID=UPI000C291D27|nr:AAA family ATPase [Alteromonas facilis]